MSTFAQIRSNVADYLNRTDLTTQINRSINRSITYYEKERFWFNETTGTFSTVSGTKNYSSSTIPSDIAEIDYVEIVVNSNDFELKPRTYEYIEQIDVHHAIGVPTDYAFYQENIYLYPIPNDIYTIRVSYQQKYTTLSADSDTNDFTVYAEDLIEFASSRWVYGAVLQNKAKSDEYAELEAVALEALREKTGKLIVVKSSIRPTEF